MIYIYLYILQLKIGIINNDLILKKLIILLNINH